MTNAQHFDAFLGLPGYSTRYVPLHYYFIQAMNTMYDHLASGARSELPPSQVVRTTPRATATTPIDVATNLPAIKPSPAQADRIRYSRREKVLYVPE